MDPKFTQLYENYQKKLSEQSLKNYQNIDEEKIQLSQLQKQFIENETAQLDIKIQERLLCEIKGSGPLEKLLQKKSVTEILLSAHNKIWFEDHGQLKKHEDQFANAQSYLSFIHRVCEQSGLHYDLKNPIANGKWRDFRIHIVAPPLCQNLPSMTLRRLSLSEWSFDKLQQQNWAPLSAIQQIQNMIEEKKNLLVIGATNSGKTSVLNALLQCTAKNERIVCIEDTNEIEMPNSASIKLLSRNSDQQGFKSYDQGALVKESLRMRPDRLVVGEVRGAEAKDLLMALATGHKGSLSTLHADDPHQALIRLEMLVQLGAPQWGLEAIRHLIRLSLDTIIVVEKKAAQRKLAGLYKISSLEKSGFCLDPIYSIRSNN